MKVVTFNADPSGEVLLAAQMVLGLQPGIETPSSVFFMDVPGYSGGEDGLLAFADCAVVLVIRDEDGPQFWHGYYGQGAYGALVAGVSALEFDLHYRRYLPEE
ncbi:MAG: hypothetical protein LOX97_08190 [Sphingomonas sp.]|nr:hypothetical protein [Sphingomonas sp.]